jgi:serine protease Do
MVNRHQGVLLTEVAPGTPAAVAGLRSGDIVARISQHEVRSVEDMSLLLQELGSNSVARFTVLRAAAPPLDLSVRLSEAQNPALETAQAEARAAEAEIKLAESAARLAAAETRLTEIEARTAQVEVRTCEAEQRVAATDALKAAAQKCLREVQERMLALQTRIEQAQERAKAAQLHMMDAQLRLHAAQVRIKRASDEHFGLPVMWLLPYGVRAISLWPPGAAPVSSRAGLLVVSIKPESRAAQAGLRLGDIIETINGRRANELGDVTEESPAETELINMLGIQRDGQSLTLKLTRPPEQ